MIQEALVALIVLGAVVFVVMKLRGDLGLRPKKGPDVPVSALTKKSKKKRDTVDADRREG